MNKLLAIVGTTFALASCASEDEADDDLASVNIGGGLYHLPDRVDAVSLELNDDHTFRWKVDGCDYFDRDEGRWSIVKGAVRLSPRGDEAMLRWFGELSRHEVSSLTLTDAPGTEPGVRVTLVEQGVSRVQSWYPGGVCSMCDGTRGSSAARRCNEPFADGLE